MMDSNGDDEQILRLFEDGDRALISGNVNELSRIYADDYVQYDESGKASTRQQVIDNLQAGRIRYVSMVSTSRRIRLFAGFGLVHGSEVDVIEQAGQRLTVRYIYMDVVGKRDGRWQILASQLANISNRELEPAE